MKKSRKAQVWLSDYTISMLIFLVAIILSFKIIMNSYSSNAHYEEMKADASKISEMLLSEGYPANWGDDSSTLVRPGLLIGKRLDAEKTAKAMNASYISYSSLKAKLQTKYDLLVIFKDAGGDMIEFNESCAIGDISGSVVTINKTGDDCHNLIFSSGYEDLVKLDRLVVHNSSVARMEVYVWKT